MALKEDFKVGDSFSKDNANNITKTINGILGLTYSFPEELPDSFVVDRANADKDGLEISATYAKISEIGLDENGAVAKAVADSDGNEIISTYATKNQLNGEDSVAVDKAIADSAGNNIIETYARIFTVDTPSGMKAGDIWVYNNSIKFYNGTTWILLNSWQ